MNDAFPWIIAGIFAATGAAMLVNRAPVRVRPWIVSALLLVMLGASLAGLGRAQV